VETNCDSKIISVDSVTIKIYVNPQNVKGDGGSYIHKIYISLVEVQLY